MYALQKIKKQSQFGKVNKQSSDWTNINIQGIKVSWTAAANRSILPLEHYWNTNEFYNFPFWQFYSQIPSFVDDTAETKD